MRINLSEANAPISQLSAGPKVEEAAEAFRYSHGVKACVLTSSGTSALKVALRCFPPGCRVAVPALTWAGVYHAVEERHKPFYIDIDPETLGIDWTLVDECDAAILVHTYGLPARLPPVDLPFIEDCAEAPYARIGGKLVGTFGVFACYSFYGNKILTCGEGGAVLGRDKDELSRAAGYTDRWHTGYNDRMGELQADVLLDQIQRREEIFSARQAIWNRYDAQIPEAMRFIPHGKSSPWLYPVKMETSAARMNVERLFKSLDVEYRRFFAPISEAPVAIEMYERGLVLPCHHKMTESDVDLITGIIHA